MLEAPHVTEAVAQPAAVIHLTVPHAERRNVVRPAVAEIMAVLDAQGLFATGPVFSHHLRMDPRSSTSRSACRSRRRSRPSAG